eukprot:NODE_999_length_2750_cov_0.286307.p1 type:complete len:268 gc:universal NODE_999_length_2750_cov_0.286307:971-168(-)
MKLKFIQKAKELKNIAEAQRVENLEHIDYSVLRKWMKKKAKIKEAELSFTRQKSKNKYRCAGGGSKPISNSALETNIYNQIMDLRKLKIRVSRKKVFEIAKDMTVENSIERFKASFKWINSFFKRFRLSLRRQSSLQTLSDDVIVERSVNYLRYLRHILCDKYYLESRNLIAMDETAVYFSSSRVTTVEVTNTSSVVVKGTGLDSERMTCVLAIKPDGTLLKLFMILKGVEDGVIIEKNGIFVTKTEKAWITEKCQYHDCMGERSIL